MAEDNTPYDLSEDETQAGGEVRTAGGARAETQMIGPYRLLQQIGEGGMGEVWLAEQETPRRQVALKLIRPGMDTKQVIARFEIERQALALMDHPCIAKVFDAGETPRGRPYFVMEYVKGDSIVEYCDKNRLSTEDRLKLLIDVCDGIEHAHHKAVIHRDLKPSNILVTIQKNRPVPKIIDFGVAKATHQNLTERTLHTQLGQLIGTLEYMSPEQAEMTGVDVDTRTDVYSLGVILYQLLAGALPFDSNVLRKAGWEESRRIIREQDPVRPSTRVSSADDTAAAVARHRRSEPSSLVRELRGDLDWIVMKALEKDRTRRYGSPNEMAADLERYLKNEPILARPASTAYRAGRFVRRHRFGVAVAGLVSLLVIAFTAATAVQARRIALERDRANQQAAVATQVSDFLIELFETSDPEESQGENVTAREILDRGAERIEQELTDQPEVQARLMSSIGWVYHTVGLFDDSERLLRRAIELQRAHLGPEHPETLESMAALNETLYRQGRYNELEALDVELLELRRRVLGEDHPDTLDSYEAVGVTYLDQGRYAEAQPLLQHVLEARRRTLGEEDPATLSAHYNLASMNYSLGRPQQAAEMYRELLEIQRRVEGENGRSTLTTQGALGRALAVLGRYQESEALLRKTLEGRQKLLGPEHDGTLMTVGELAGVIGDQGRHTEAEEQFRELVETRYRISGPDHPRTRSALRGHGLELMALGRYDEADEQLTLALDRERRFMGDEHPGTLAYERSLARLRIAEGRFDEALEILEPNVAAVRTAPGDPLDLADALTLCGEALQAVGPSGESEFALAEALALFESVLPDDHPDIARTRELLELARSDSDH
jgi:non-specific serine/threonine protein kinase/serine/threonine-protein kinase